MKRFVAAIVISSMIMTLTVPAFAEEIVVDKRFGRRIR